GRRRIGSDFVEIAGSLNLMLKRIDQFFKSLRCIPNTHIRRIDVYECAQNPITKNRTSRKRINVQKVVASTQAHLPAFFLDRTEAGKVDLPMHRIWCQKAL